MTTQSTTAIQEELKKIESSLVKENLTREQYLELYSAQQALTWALNSKLAAAPHDVIVNGKVQPRILDSVVMDTPAN